MDYRPPTEITEAVPADRVARVFTLLSSPDHLKDVLHRICEGNEEDSDMEIFGDLCKVLAFENPETVPAPLFWFVLSSWEEAQDVFLSMTPEEFASTIKNLKAEGMVL